MASKQWTLTDTPDRYVSLVVQNPGETVGQPASEKAAAEYHALVPSFKQQNKNDYERLSSVICYHRSRRAGNKWFGRIMVKVLPGEVKTVFNFAFCGPGLCSFWGLSV